MAIKRIWHGWTTKENADRYQAVLRQEVIPSIENKNIPGFTRMEVLRFEREDEVEFVTIMTFQTLQSVIDFQGEEYKRCYVPPVARKVLKRWDQEAIHYDLVDTRTY